MAKTAPELIGFHLGWDMSEVTEGKYQRTQNPAIYVCGGDYFVCPTEKQKLPEPHEYKWEPVGTYYGRTVYRGKV